ncbi:MAG: diphthine--ammonia ligase [Candidatus Nanohaloarchaea archaeon]|nr:diphthine--ammonia ligase [Candidatus Nanohaloarchaea archaeon]
MVRVAVAWSGGKDSALALHDVMQRRDMTVDRLVTTVAAEHDRVSIHGVRTELLRAQADAMGVPLDPLELPPGYTRADHDAAMRDALDRLAGRGVDAVVYADIFLADVRRDREQLLADAGLDGLWPLWNRDTASLADRFIDAGFAATLVCVDTDRLDPSFAGRRYDRDLLQDLPAAVDPCGEHGAFHTFVHDAPVFDGELAVRTGDTVLRDTEGGTMAYADLVADR